MRARPRVRPARSSVVQSHGIAQTVFGAPVDAPGRSDATACAPSVVRSTTFQPLPWQMGQSARAMKEEYAGGTRGASGRTHVQIEGPVEIRSYNFIFPRSCFLRSSKL